MATPPRPDLRLVDPTPQALHRRASHCPPLVLDAAKAVVPVAAQKWWPRATTASRSVTSEGSFAASTTTTTENQMTAYSMARQSPQAGYLEKQGQHVPGWKRRFFVLQPSTQLWYFLSAHDVEPRGCLDLQGSKVTVMSDTELMLEWPDTRVRLQGNSSIQEWAQHLTECRYDVLQDKLQETNAQLSQSQAQRALLQDQVEHYRHVQEELMQSKEETAEWKMKYEQMEEQVRLLSLQLAKPADVSSTCDALDNDDWHGNPHWTSLVNAIQQLQHNCSLAAQEATTAVEDLQKMQQDWEQRHAKAVGDLWQENCSLRQSWKQTKREKRRLVREVKALREAQVLQASAAQPGPEEDDGVDEEQLLNELEEHVNSCVQLHEQFMSGRPSGKQLIESAAKKRPTVAPISDEVEEAVSPDPSSTTAASIPTSQRQPLASLLDEDSTDGSSSEEEPSVAISSTAAESSQQSEPSPKPPHPLDLLAPGGSELSYLQQPQLTEPRASPTAKLACPLEDVRSTAQNTASQGDGQIYHLTFYSRKIGLQFQKVPPSRPRGLLTDALLSDVGDATQDELRRIASLHAKQQRDDRPDEDILQVATPKDAVLVCGFHGFDDTGTNVRPKLGARLVAFDGISVEVGEWTFDAIRKAIQARGRPLTLSFRNDFLTTEQRRILTKAVHEIGLPPPLPKDDDMSRDSELFINDTTATTLFSRDDDMSSLGVPPLSFSGSRSVNSRGSGHNCRSFSETGSSLSNGVGPYVTSLLQKHPMAATTPNYLRRAPESVEDTPQHQDFKSELL